MGKQGQPLRVKLIAGIIYSPDVPGGIRPVEARLEALYGPISMRSDELKFNLTDYYNQEMGYNLLRYWICFDNPVSQEKLALVKAKANELEDALAVNGSRLVNIDPGYITASRLVLFSTKDFSHRIYIEDGIYAEVTLLYRNNAFQDLPWTYPDYRLDAAKKFFRQAREQYLEQVPQCP